MFLDCNDLRWVEFLGFLGWLPDVPVGGYWLEVDDGGDYGVGGEVDDGGFEKGGREHEEVAVAEVEVEDYYDLGVEVAAGLCYRLESRGCQVGAQKVLGLH